MYKIISRTFNIFLLIINDLLLFGSTIFARTKKWERFDGVWKGWNLFPEHINLGSLQPLMNLFLLTPMLYLTCVLFPDFFKKNKYLKGLLIGFLTSLFIEATQLITMLGTFQFSDLVYNTLSAIIGVGIYDLFRFLFGREETMFSKIY